MTLEQGAISGLCFLFMLIWKDRQDMRKELVGLRGKVEQMARKLGMAEGQLQAVKGCPIEECPLRDDHCARTITGIS